MAEVAAVEPCDLTVVSTFSGTGGACLGYKLAGFDVAWANDCDPAAQACYRINHPTTRLDTRDIREVQPAEILAATGLAEGELDVFEGSPPCTNFSGVGRRTLWWNKTKQHAGRAQENVEDLFFEWLRLLEGLKPRACQAENVSGMARGAAKGYMLEVLKRMQAAGYRAEARILDAQWLGVAQTRSRIFFVGMREDQQKAPPFPLPIRTRYSILDALPAFCVPFREEAHGAALAALDAPPAAKALIMKDGAALVFTRYKSTSVMPVTYPVPAVLATAQFGGKYAIHACRPDGTIEARLFRIDEVKALCSFPVDFRLEGSYVAQWGRLGNAVPPLMAYHVAAAIRDRLLGVR